jgi:hypothetical protein
MSIVTSFTVSPLSAQDDETLRALRGAVGQRIESIECIPGVRDRAGLEMDQADKLCFRLQNGMNLLVYDSAQSCCERRYMTIDDELDYYAGTVLYGIEVVSVPPTRPVGEDNLEMSFLVVRTSAGEFVVAMHNEHNGYYGGFALGALLIAASQDESDEEGNGASDAVGGDDNEFDDDDLYGWRLPPVLRSRPASPPRPRMKK